MRLTVKQGFYAAGLFILALLVMVLIRDFTSKANANSDGYTISLLEITDTGTSDLKLNKNGSIQVDTMSMKRFVSLREDLDGKYDAIYIGKGLYSTLPVNGRNHNTTTVMNDITPLKAQQIVDLYIQKGLYVFFSTDPFDRQKVNERGNLYQYFNTYRSESPKPNVVFLNSTQLTDFAAGLQTGNSPYIAGMKQRPQLALANKGSLIDYEVNPAHVYNTGDELVFQIQAPNISDFKTRPVTANLYMTVDKSTKMDKDQIVATTNLTQGTGGEIRYKLPKTYSGLLYWKLEIVDRLNPNQLKDYETGTIRYRGKKTVVSILQVMPNTDKSSLKKSTVMKQSYLSGTDYELNVEVKTINQFNDYVKNKRKENGSYGLNGTYDMLIFGFADVYNTVAPISAEAAQGVEEFITKTKQSAMFTHDTIYRSKTQSEWTNRFQAITGQIEPETNLGLSAPNTSKVVVPVNEGLLTQYPFDLSDSSGGKKVLEIATTHNQYFTLDLNDESVIPWYNISGSQRDVNDSWNHYYTYSKGNVTYSGTGHVQTFPDWEQRLFVNTMYRAFTGSNHAPEITVLTPEHQSTKPSYLQDLVISYTVDDWDWKDKDLTTAITFKGNGQPLDSLKVDNQQIQSGKTFTHSIKNPLPEGGKLEIEISAWDKQGAMTTKTIEVQIEKVSINLETSRTLSSNVINNEVRRGEEVGITYTITPKPIPYMDIELSEQGKQQLIISDIRYEEQFPPGLDIIQLPAGAESSGSLSAGYTVKYALGDIVYELKESNGVKSYEPLERQQIVFDLSMRPTVKGIYLLNNSRIDYEDIHLPDSLKEQPEEAPQPFEEDPAPRSALGIGKDYTVFALENVWITSSGFSNEGRIAAGGDMNLNNFSVGDQLDYNSANRYTLIAGGNMTLNGGTIHNGKGAYGGTATVPEYLKPKLVQDQPVDFEAATQAVQRISQAAAALTPTAAPVIQCWNNPTCSINLTGTRSDLNVFTLTAQELERSHKLVIDAPADSTVLINVTGTSAKMSGGLELKGVDEGHVLFHFPDAVSLNTSSISVKGSILAPLADYKLHGKVFGTVVVRSMTDGSGHHIHLRPFEGVLSVPGASPSNPPKEDPAAPRPRVSTVFPELIFRAVVKVTAIQMEGTTILSGTEHKLTPVVLPEDADQKQLTWSSNRTDIVTVNSEGLVTGLKAGTAKVTAAATDGSGIRKAVEIRVINRDLSISGPDTAFTRETFSLEATYVTANETVTGYVWSVKPVNGQNLSDMVRLVTNPQDPSLVEVVPLRKGEVTIMVTVLTNRFPQGAATAEHTVTIQQRLDAIYINGPASIPVGAEATLVLLTEPYDADETGFQWTLEGDGGSYARLTPSADGSTVTVTGLRPNEAITIRASTGWDQDNLTALHQLKIVPVLEGLYLTDAVLNQGGTLNMYDSNLRTRPADFPRTLLQGYLRWESDNPDVATVDASNGMVSGKKKGVAKITVTYSFEGRTLTATGTVKVNETVSGDRY
ncbi:DUF5057 domain-containing protein [Paenibacillus sp. JSM ZJ436]|uniref:DUF5057 domain-containing protein n=1 Tax=Paenibacillus sp. JSM ZJ436 TaxID=3376190 RepID=UPI00379727DD